MRAPQRASQNSGWNLSDTEPPRGPAQLARPEILNAPLATARRAVDLAEDAGTGLGLTWAHTTLGAAAFLAGDLESAVSEQELALEITRRTRGFKSHEPVILAALGEARLASGDSAGALLAAEEGVASGVESKAPAFEARAQLTLARVLAERGNARERVEAALVRCEALIAATGAERFSAGARALRDHEGL
jgi:hypothetical protein